MKGVITIRNLKSLYYRHPFLVSFFAWWLGGMIYGLVYLLCSKWIAGSALDDFLQKRAWMILLIGYIIWQIRLGRKELIRSRYKGARVFGVLYVIFRSIELWMVCIAFLRRY